MDLWNLVQIDSRLDSFQNILIQINSRLKQLYFQKIIQTDSWLKKLSGILIRVNSWLGDSN